MTTGSETSHHPGRPVSGSSHPARHTGPRPGRPLDEALTRRIQDVAVDLILAGGVSNLRVDQIAAVGRCGKAAIYRRWPHLNLLVAGLTDRVSFLPDLSPGWPLRLQLQVVGEAWTGPLARAEELGACLLGGARHNAVLHRRLTARLDEEVGAWRPAPGVDPVDYRATTQFALGLMVLRLHTGPLDRDTVDRFTGLAGSVYSTLDGHQHTPAPRSNGSSPGTP